MPVWEPAGREQSHTLVQGRGLVRSDEGVVLVEEGQEEDSEGRGAELCLLCAAVRAARRASSSSRSCRISVTSEEALSGNLVDVRGAQRSRER